MKRKHGGGRAGIVLAAIVALAPLAQAQSGDGYLFGRPTGSFTLRGGFSRASASSDLFDEMTQDLTLKKSDFSGLTGGLEAAVRLGEYVDLSADIGYMRTSSPSSYRGFVDNNNREIEQVTTLLRIPLTGNLKVYFAPRGRSVGRFAWIPSHVTPWAGVGAGVMRYNLRQEGDFIDFATTNVRADRFESHASTPMMQGMLGVDVTISPRLAVTGDVRRLWVRSPALGSDYLGYQPIDLSGGVVSLGLTVRL